MEPSGTVSGTDAFILLQIKMSIVGAISDWQVTLNQQLGSTGLLRLHV